MKTYLPELRLVAFLLTFLTPYLKGSPPLAMKSTIHNRDSILHGTTSNHIGTGKPWHFKHPQKEFWHMRNQVDKLELRQKIDRIHIQNLQKKVRKITAHSKIQNFGNKNIKNLNFNERKFQADLNLKSFRNKNSMNFETVQNSPQINLDLIEGKILEKLNLQIKQIVMDELKNIRSKMTEMEGCCKRCNAAKPSNSRGEATLHWMLQVVPSLQKNVADIQESTNVVQALHDKQDFDSRLRALTDDVTGLQKKWTTMTSKVESVVATTDTLKEEVKDTSSRIHRVEGNIIRVNEQMEEQKDVSDDLLKALPDGFVYGHLQDNIVNNLEKTAITRRPQLIDGDDSSMKNKMALNDRVEKLELVTSSLDFALMNLQKKIFLETVQNIRQNSPATTTTSNSVTKESIPKTPKSVDSGVSESEIQMELSKLKDSSESVLKALSAIERRNGEVAELINRKLSKVETQIEREREERTSKNVDTRSKYLETEKEIRDDYVELKNDVTFLKKQFITIDDRQKSFENKLSQNDFLKSFFDDDQRHFMSKIKEVCYETVKAESYQNDNRISELEKLYKIVDNISSKNSKLLSKRLRHKRLHHKR